MRTVHRHIAAIARTILLLVGRLVLLIHNHELQILHRRKDRRTRLTTTCASPLANAFQAS